LESLARENNPTLLQADQHIAAERARAQQAGLYPNPVAGYAGEQLGVMGTAGEFHGVFVRQEIVTAGKLGLSRDKYLARASAAESLARAQELRVINSVRVQFYRTLGARRRHAIQREILETAEDHLVTVKEMLNVGQADQAELHLAQVLLREQQLNLERVDNELRMERETLMAIVGLDRPPGPLVGELEDDTEPELRWEEALERLLEQSPELEAARAKLESDEITVRREKAEPIPNIELIGAVGRNFEAGETVYSAEVAVEIPLFDRNQGTVRQAEADFVRQRNEVRRTELRLRQSLAHWHQRYQTAAQHVDAYREVVLPEARQRYVTELRSYEQNRQSWPAVLASQKDFFLRRLIYVDHLVARREARVIIDGYFLMGGLMAAPGVAPAGHIAAVPKPR
jgi:outer membrane protein TolC